MSVIVLGGGMVGMLAKFVFPHATVLDWRRLPPRMRMNGAKQFGAQYLWEPLPGIPCRSFTVSTTIDGEPATLRAAVNYKEKIGKPKDIAAGWERQFASPTTGYSILSIPGADQWEFQWQSTIDHIEYDRRMVQTRGGQVYQYDLLISTIPLPSLLEMLRPRRWRDLIWQSQTVSVRETALPPDAPVIPEDFVRVNYISNQNTPVYRTTDRDGMRHFEWLAYHKLAGGRDMGIPTKRIKPGKIWPNPYSGEIRDTLARAGIHCAGRFGQWEPDQLLHQTFQHLRHIREVEYD